MYLSFLSVFCTKFSRMNNIQSKFVANGEQGLSMGRYDSTAGDPATGTQRGTYADSIHSIPCTRNRDLELFSFHAAGGNLVLRSTGRHD